MVGVIVFAGKEMAKHFTTFLGFSALVALMAFLLIGCEPIASNLDKNPDFARARQAADAGEYRVAVSMYQKMLRQAPGAARIHLELGLLYDERLNDPIAAIYHYQTYLEMEPNSNRKEVIAGFVERAKLAYAARLPQTIGGDPNEVAQLRLEKMTLVQENAALRSRLADLERATATAALVNPPAMLPGEVPRTIVVTQVTAVVTSPVTPAYPVPPGSTGTMRTHVVQKGDTLQSIARRYYNSPVGWEKIYAANRAVLANKDSLRVGQTLVIP